MKSRYGDVLLGFADFFSDVRVGAAPRVDPVKDKGKGPDRTFPYPAGKKNVDVERQGKVLQTGKKQAADTVKRIRDAVALLKKKPTAKPKLTVVKVGATLSPKVASLAQKQGDAVKANVASTKNLAGKVVASKKSATELAKRLLEQKQVSRRLRGLKPGELPRTQVKQLNRKLINYMQHATGKPLKSPTPSTDVPNRNLLNLMSKSSAKLGDLVEHPVVGEEVAEILNEYYTAVGAKPDPQNPGFLDDGNLDPAYWGDIGVDVPGGTSSEVTEAAAEEEDPFDDGTAWPAVPEIGEFVLTSYKDVGGLKYDGQKGYPNGFAGSFGLFTRTTDDRMVADTAGIDGTNHFGYVWGRFHDKTEKGGLPFGDKLKPNTWNKVGGREVLGSTWSWPVDAAEAVASNKPESNPQSPQGKAYGPIVGNPNMPDFARMRMDKDGTFFFYPQEAPDWLTFPIKQAAAITAQAADKARKDREAVDKAIRDKAQRDADLEKVQIDLEKARTDAERATREAEAESQSRITAMEQEGEANKSLLEQAAVDTESRRADIEARRAEAEERRAAAEQQRQEQSAYLEQMRLDQQAALQQRQMEMAQQQQAMDIMLQQAQAEQAYLAEHPELLYPQQPQLPPGYGPPQYSDYGPPQYEADYGYYDYGPPAYDYGPVPGAELMQDPYSDWY